MKAVQDKQACLPIGETLSGDPFTLPANASTQKIALMGKSGSGKTYAATKLAESLYRIGVQIVALDPVGVWYGLRLDKSGKGEGLPIPVFGGEYGDIPLEPGAGALVAETIVSRNISVILDVSSFRKGQRKEFVTAFAEELFHRKKASRSPVMLFLEEAQTFCMTPDTEILTSNGWRTWDKVKTGDLVSAFNLSTETYQYEPIQRVITRQYHGEMVHLKTDRLDCLVTPDHRVVLRRIQRRSRECYKLYDWTFCPASDVPSCVHIPTGGASVGVGIPELSNELLRIMGWIITDGYFHDRSKSATLGIQQSYTTIKLGQSIVSAMDSVLVPLEVGRYERPARRGRAPQGEVNASPSVQYYLGQDLSRQLTKWLGEDIHCIPRRILEECSREQLQVLLQGLMEGDGTSRGDRWVTFYAGRNEALANDLQELALRLGISSTKDYVRQNKQWVVRLTQRKHHHVTRPRRQFYSGLVWDITVPSGAFVARRNGKVFVTGNCPQKTFKGEEKMLGAFEDIGKVGRNYGIGLTMISQRPQAVNKEVLNQAEALFALQMMAAQERKAIRDWIDAQGIDTGAVIDDLPHLRIGEAYVWSPMWLRYFGKIKFSPKETYNASATPTFNSKASARPRHLKPEDLAALQEAMQEVVKQAEAKDPATLRRRIVQLEQQLKTNQAQIQVERVEVPVLKDEQVTELKRSIEGLAEMGQQLVKVAQDLGTALAKAISPASSPPQPVKQTPLVTQTRPPKAAAAKPTSDTGLRAGERRMLETLARRYPIRVTRSQLGTLAGFTASGGTFGAYLGTLKRGGYIQEAGGEIQITQVGLDCLGLREPPMPQTTQEVLEMWHKALRAGERRMLDKLVEIYPDSLSREVLGEQTGFTSSGGTFGAYLGVLRRNGLVEVDENGVRASDTLFLE